MASIVTKPFNEIEYSDIADMVDNKVSESDMLDYKEIFGDTQKVANLISALANTYGGYIVFGVREKRKTNKPEEIVGLSEPEKDLDSKLTNTCYDKIMPPVFVESKHLTSEDKSLRVFLVRVPESDTTPHAVDGNTTVYIKVRDQKRPIAKADLGRIQWLANRRVRHVELRESLIERAFSRVPSIIPRLRSSGRHYSVEVVVVPKYPRSVLCEFNGLHSACSIVLNGLLDSRPHFILRPESEKHFNVGISYSGMYHNDDTQVALSLDELGTTCFAFGQKKFGESENSIFPKAVADVLFHGLTLQLRFLKQCNFIGDVLIVSRIAGIHDAVLRTGNEVNILLERDFKCELESELPVNGEYRVGEINEIINDFVTKFIAKMYFLFGVRGDTIECGRSIVTKAILELPASLWHDNDQS